MWQLTRQPFFSHYYEDDAEDDARLSSSQRRRRRSSASSSGPPSMESASILFSFCFLKETLRYSSMTRKTFHLQTKHLLKWVIKPSAGVFFKALVICLPTETQEGGAI